MLHERRVKALVADADFIRDQLDTDERMDEAKRHVREAMLQHALGRISIEERDRILDILLFAVSAKAFPEIRSETPRDFDDHLPYGSLA